GCHPFLGRSQLPPGGGASADPPELGLGLLHPEAGADTIEGGERLRERCTGGRLLLRAALHHAQSEERAGGLERPRDALMVLDGPYERSQCARKIAVRGQKQPAAAAAATAGSRAVERHGDLLERLEQRDGLVEAPERDQGLDVVDDEVALV